MSFWNGKESVCGFTSDFSPLRPFMRNSQHSAAHKAALLPSPPLLIHELCPHCETTSRRWAAFSISFVGCLQVLYLGMFGHYSLAFGQLCSHTINNKPSSRGDVCTFVVILLKQVHTCWAVFGQQRFPHLLMLIQLPGFFFSVFVSFLMKPNEPTFCRSLNGNLSSRSRAFWRACETVGNQRKKKKKRVQWSRALRARPAAA